MGGPVLAMMATAVSAGLIVCAAPAYPQAANRGAAPPSADSGVQHITAGPIAVDLSLDRSSINAAESVTVTLRVTAPASVHVEFPSAEGKLDGFTIVSATDEPARAASVNGEVATVRTRRYALEPFLPGDYTVPALEIPWRRDTGESGVARTEPVAVRVVSLLPAPTGRSSPDPKALDPGTIRGAYVAPTHQNWWPLAGIAGAGLGAVLLAGWGARAYRRRRKEPDVLPALIARIETLRATASDRPASSDLYHELAGALRIALADRIDPRALSLPAAEIAADLPRTALFSGDDANGVQRLLVRLDEVRFSGGTLSRDERDALLAATLDTLRKLRSMPPREVAA